MAWRGFRDLVVYRKAVEFAGEVHSKASRWESFDRWTVGVQLVRSADSVGANIAEALGRRGTADQRRLLFIARGSAFETEHWIDVAIDRGLACPRSARDRAAELGRMLNGLLSSDN
jgi:four helix bundle protein